MEKILLFGGTSEGKDIAGFLCCRGVPVTVCVATAYGEEKLEADPHLTVLTGRKNEQEITALLKSGAFTLVLDATHPYAEEVTENVRKACLESEITYLRIKRPSLAAEGGAVKFFSDVPAAVEYLDQTSGNILLTTGSKDLDSFVEIDGAVERLYVRVLPARGVFKKCEELQITGSHLICMQGPFVEEMNYGLLKQVKAAYLVTKESGKAGGFSEKCRAARRAGAELVVIGRPADEEGMDLEQAKKWLMERPGIPVQRKISCIGIGPGSKDGMTVEAIERCRDADILIGAARMLETVSYLGKRTFVSSKAQEIAAFLEEHPVYEKVAVLFSGDTGFYSGAARITEYLPEEQVEFLPGISSICALSARMKGSWQDAKIVSLHGRSMNLLDCVKRHKKVMALTGSGEDIAVLCRQLVSCGLGEVLVSVGERLSYPDERFWQGRARAFTAEKFGRLCVAAVQNPAAGKSVVTHGIPDNRFLRGKVPMTKEEVRSISLSKLALCRESVVYDIGAGSGSVAVEAALQAADGMVYAVERKPEAAVLIEENKKKFGISNLEVIRGTAPEASSDLPVPTHVFVGGSAGNMEAILIQALQKNPDVRVVINAITLETVAETLEILKQIALDNTEIVQVQVSRAKETGPYHMMQGQNPVYIISGGGGDRL